MLRRLTLEGLGAVSLCALAISAGFGQEDRAVTPIGFAPASRAAETRAEAFALAVPTPNQARAWLHHLTEEPHVAGSPADYQTALFVRDRLREWGWQADLAEYEVLLNYPGSLINFDGQYLKASARLELLKPIEKSLPLIENALASDKDSASPKVFPAFHGYGVSGDVTAQVIYVNYARPEDFAVLDKVGIEVKGKIVLARYGEVFRGLKVRDAQRRGARGILIYSDPADDGYAKGDVYPAGPFRPGSAIQRGSIQFLSLGPGDPSTPDGPSVKGAKRLPTDRLNGFPNSQEHVSGDLLHTHVEVTGQCELDIAAVKEWEKATGLKRTDYFASIPSLPISYDAARPILEALAGPNVPGGWQGGLPFAYHIGPGPAEVHFAVSMDYRVRPIWNVIATIKGDVEPDRWVLMSNHRDAWVYGAVDPGSGTASTLETCRALGAAVRHGWKPRRTLMYASWDAEEYGLVGSTEWAEEHAREIDERAVLMLNVDSAVGGTELDVEGVPSLRDLLLDASGAITDIRSGKTLRRLWTERRRAAWAQNESIDLFDPVWDAPTGETRPSTRFSPQMNPLGSGSDYTPFLDHLGVPAIDVGFGGRYGVYHSIYDTFTWMEKYGDPEFLTHTTAARLYTVFMMRAAGAEVVPLKFVPYAEALRDHVNFLRRLVERQARAAEPGQGKPPLPFEGLPRLVKSVRALTAQAETLDRTTDALARRDGVPPAQLALVNDALMKIERAFLLPQGLPGRPWFKHAVYAPGLTTGYASWPLPGLRQAIQDNDPEMLAAQLAALIGRLDAATVAMKDISNE